jgi:hypothetical protein
MCLQRKTEEVLLSVRAVDKWNGLPETAQQANTSKAFVKSLKSVLRYKMAQSELTEKLLSEDLI